jgi:hypothetical protein
MEMKTCDWNKYDDGKLIQKQQRHEITASGKLRHPMLTGCVGELNDRYIERFSFYNC